jgi:hypothetical protein
MCATAGKDGRVAAVELTSGKKKGVGVGAPGRMNIHSARGISDSGALVGDDGYCTTVVGADAGHGHNGALVGDDGYSTRIAFVGRAGYDYFFI